jgi:hypothetical protein
MRLLPLIFGLTGVLGGVAAVSPAKAWYDGWGRWQPNYTSRPIRSPVWPKCAS